MHGASRTRRVDGNVKGVEFLFKKNKIDCLQRHRRASPAPGKVEVTGEDGTNQVLETKNIVIATGSDVTPLPGVEIDEKVIVSSTGALELAEVPEAPGRDRRRRDRARARLGLAAARRRR